MTRDRITVLLVEDHKLVRKGVRALLELEDDIKVVGEADNGNQAVQLAKSLHPQVILMDIALPILNGIEAARQILRIDPKAKILILSAYADDSYIERTMALGICGYLIKQCSPNVLIQAIHAVTQGKTFYSPVVLDRMASLTKSRITHRGEARLSARALSEREAQTLQLIAEGKSNKQAASEMGISVKTVEKHRQNLMKKLSIHDVAGLTRYAIAEGIVESNPVRRRTSID